MRIGEARPAKIRHGISLAPNHVVQHPKSHILDQGTQPIDIVITANDPDGAAILENTAALRQPLPTKGVIGLEEGSVITDIQGCFSLSNAVNITKTEVNGGSLIIENNGGTDIVICKEGSTNSTVNLGLTGNLGDESRYLLTTPIGNILDISFIPSFSFSDEPSDDFAIWHVSYELGTTGIEIGGNINQINGCHDLSNPVSVSLQNVNGGVIQTIDGQMSHSINLNC